MNAILATLLLQVTDTVPAPLVLTPEVTDGSV